MASPRVPNPQPRGSAPAAPSDLLAGTPYRFLAAIGRGGMGEVVAAEHITLGKRVVVKLLHSKLADRPDHVDRMRLEAQALARLDHPNLVVVHDYGRTAAGRPYIVMEHLLGRTLREELKARGRLPPVEAIDLVRQALAGLGAAHAIGLVHRDVKLDNLFICEPVGGVRTLKVLDFGIAKVLPEASAPSTPAPLAFPTEEGVALGTPRFFAPEQARGVAVDPRTDVYSAGVVLYALLAGRGPFDHVHAIYDLALAQVEEVPEPPSVHAGVPLPPALERTVLRAIAKRPEDRFPSAGTFSAELARVAADLAAPSPPGPPGVKPSPSAPLAPRRPPQGLHPATFAAVVVVTAACVAALTLGIRALVLASTHETSGSGRMQDAPIVPRAAPAR